MIIKEGNSWSSEAVANDPRQQSTGSRRGALKTALAGGVVIATGSVPAKWVAPVVDSVMLPAHGATSDAAGPWSSTLSMDQAAQTQRPRTTAGPLFALKPQSSQPGGKPVPGMTRNLVPSIADTLLPSAHSRDLEFRGPFTKLPGLAIVTINSTSTTVPAL